MRFMPVHPFIGATERAEMLLDAVHQPEGQAGLPAARGAADRTVAAYVGQDTVQRGRRCNNFHGSVSSDGFPAFARSNSGVISLACNTRA